MDRRQNSAAECAIIRDLISAGADDELAADETLRLERHFEFCVACRDYADRIAALTRLVRLRPVGVDPDFVERVLDRQPVRLGRGGWLRPALAWCAVLIAVQSARPLFLAELDGTPTHIARHVGAFAMALAIGLAYAAWRPHRAAGMLPFVVALLITTAASAVFDAVAGTRSALAETVHVTELAGLVLLWMVAGSPGWDRVSRHLPGAGGRVRSAG